MRMALVEVIGCLIRELAVSSDLTTDSNQTQKQLNGLYDLLLERMLDLSSYVRAKVIAVLARLCDLPAKFPKQRLAVTRAAADALEDKAAGVRKGAVVLLVKLIVTHPYGLMHGGLLGLGEWEQRYAEVSAELNKVEGVVGKAVEIADDADREGGDGDEGNKGSDEEDSEQDGEGEGEESDGEPTQRRRKRYVSIAKWMSQTD